MCLFTQGFVLLSIKFINYLVQFQNHFISFLKFEHLYRMCYFRVGRISIIPANFPDFLFFNVIIVLWWLEIFLRFNKLNSFLFSGSSNWQTYQCSAETGETLSKGICILPSVFHYFSGLLGGYEDCHLNLLEKESSLLRQIQENFKAEIFVIFLLNGG